jgi:ribonuclease BN (tRNA processing enzyme)
MGETVLELFCGPPCDSGVCYPCFKSALIPATKLVLFDVGHGDFMLLFNENDLLVVDCGSINSIHRDIQSIANRIQTRCPNTALLISHLHQDHYNFLKYFSNRFFKKIWLPVIPVTRESRRIGEAMLKYLFLSMLSDFLDYGILLPSVFEGFKDRVRFLKKGNTFRWAGTNWEVLWPDLGDPIFAAKVLQKVVPLEERLKNVDDITEKYGFNEIFEQVADRITSILETREEEQSARFYRELSDMLKKMDRKLETEDEKRRVRDVLQGADKDFRGLANWLSLVVRSDTNDFLFLGDA